MARDRGEASKQWKDQGIESNQSKSLRLLQQRLAREDKEEEKREKERGEMES